MPGTARFPGLDWTFDGADPLTMAEAFGHAWVQQQAGGSVTLVAADRHHPWWPVLRAWLPITAPLDIGEGVIEALPQRPFPPIHLASLPRSGIAPWGITESLDASLRWLAEREPAVMIARESPHPAIAVALAAIASWGMRVCWHVPGTAGMSEALNYIGVRQLPLHLVIDGLPEVVPEGWLVVGHDEFALWVQHEWPTIYVPTALATS